MTKIIFGILAGLILGAAITWKALQHGEHAEGKEAEKHKEDSHVISTNDQTFVKLDAEAQKKVGLQLSPLEAASLAPEIKGTARVLDPAPLAALLAEVAAVGATLDASQKELERLKVLDRDQNTSGRALEVAAAAVQRDQIAAEAARLKLVTSWGPAIAGQRDLAGFVARLASQEAALVRVDLTPSDQPKAPPVGIRVASLSAPESPVEAQILGAAATVDPQTQGQGFLGLVKGGALIPGAALSGWLMLAGSPEHGVIVPRAAIVRHEGEAFVYVQTDPELFLRQEIELARPTAQGWFVSEGLKAGDKVVTVGAQQLLSEELKGEGGEE